MRSACYVWGLGSSKEIWLSLDEQIPVLSLPLFLLSIESQDETHADLKPVTLPHLPSMETVGIQHYFGLHFSLKKN